MTDIFDATILCKHCNKKMNPTVVNKQGSELRAIQCVKCKDLIFHPADLNSLDSFKNLKGKTYNVKLRIVGNSHAVSIPKEIVNFMHQQERIMDDMVKLHLDDMRRMSLVFGSSNTHDHREEF
jgi:hypothetical protein